MRRTLVRRITDSLPTFLRAISLPDTVTLSTAKHEPTVEDVVKLRQFLIESYLLPVEIVDVIVDYAEYWPHTTTRLAAPTGVRSGSKDENQMLLRSYPLGFVPSDDDQDPGQMLRQYKQTYQNLKPEPWAPNLKVPETSTEEVLKYWEAKSLPRSEHPCRKIVFKIKSHDQGWGDNRANHGIYQNSYTWFDFGLEKVSSCKESEFLSPLLSAGTYLLKAWEVAPFPKFRLIGDLCEVQKDPTISLPSLVCSLRTIIPSTQVVLTTEFERNQGVSDTTTYEFKHDLNPEDKVLQKNKRATRDTTEHIITWSSIDNIKNPESPEAAELEKQGRGKLTGSGEFVRNMKLGEVVTVWAKARYPGWYNTIDDLQIEVYWAV